MIVMESGMRRLIAGLLGLIFAATDAAFALGASQRARLLRAGEWWLGANPGHGEAGVRFDVVLVDGAGRIRRIADAFRLGD